MMFDAHEQARALFPLMPEEVFRLWMDERIESNGWPPDTGTWEAALRFRSVGYWQKLHWQKKGVLLIPESLSGETRRIIRSLYQGVFSGIPTEETRYVGDSRERITGTMRYIAQHGRLPSCLIFLEEDGVYEIVDGCHRLTAFFVCHSDPEFKNRPSQTQEAWVGSVRR